MPTSNDPRPHDRLRQRLSAVQYWGDDQSARARFVVEAKHFPPGPAGATRIWAEDEMASPLAWAQIIAADGAACRSRT